MKKFSFFLRSSGGLTLSCPATKQKKNYSFVCVLSILFKILPNIGDVTFSDENKLLHCDFIKMCVSE